MRSAAFSFVFVALCLSGCGGTLVLHDETGTRAPAPQTVPVHRQWDLSRDEAVQVVATQANRGRITHLRVDSVERKRNEWRVNMSGVDCDGREVDIYGKVDRRSGVLKSYKLEEDRDHHRGHGKGHSHHDGHDDHDD